MTCPIEGIIQIDGDLIWTVRQGVGALAVVLCHGGPGAYDTLGPVADMIDDLAVVYRYDQRGGGRSDRVGPYTVERFVEDLDAVRRHYGIERWVVGGHSAGANLALRYAMAHPSRVIGLIYLNGTGLERGWVDKDGVRHDWGDYHLACEAKLSTRQRLSLESLTDREARREIISQADYYDPESVIQKQVYERYPINMEANETLGHMADATHVPEAGKLKMPALIVHGEGDPRPLEPVKRLAGTLPDARLHVIEKMGHYPYLEAVDQTRKLLRQFVAELT